LKRKTPPNAIGGVLNH